MRKSRMAAAIARIAGSIDVIPDYITMTGGVDYVTAPLSRRSGTARFAQNFEALQLGGYRRIPGYERHDGRVAPSAAQYAILNANITGSAALGNTLTGATSGATGVIIALPTGQFVLTKVTGTFVNGENLHVGGPTIATADGTQFISGAATPLLNAQYRNLAADNYRADIAAVPGSGNVLGVWRYNGVTYAFRNNAGGTAAEMYKSTASGWTKVNFEYEVAFTAGGGDIDDGDTLTQGGVTATIRRVVIRTGTLAGSNAAGILVISAPSGGNFAAGAATTNTAGTLTLSGVQTAITLAPNGRYEFITENFGGGTSTRRMYGCDGQNRAFEFDGTYYVPIPTGMTVDKPSHIWAHKHHLFLSFDGSVQHSGIGKPFAWTPVLGASEIAMGDMVTGFSTLPGSEAGGALAIFTRNRTYILYGSSSANWNLVGYREELGAYAHTIQDVGFTVFLDDRGMTDLQAAQEFGNFAHSAFSNQVKNLITDFRALASASCISRDLAQYRLFFSNGYSLYATFSGRRLVGIMPMLYADQVLCVCSVEDTDGQEVIYFGSDNGFVYQMDRGTSFDGEPITFALDLAYNFCKTPRINKFFRDAMLEIDGTGYAEFNFGYSLGYGSTEISQPSQQITVTNFSAVKWDAFVWDSFFWDGQTLFPSILNMGGEAINYSLAINGESDYFEPFTITGAVIQYSPRRRER